tara:strand:+ start:200 stop:430 length:231 start_codon:yes stop_codon:yes gene_type:complete
MKMLDSYYMVVKIRVLADTYIPWNRSTGEARDKLAPESSGWFNDLMIYNKFIQANVASKYSKPRSMGGPDIWEWEL